MVNLPVFCLREERKKAGREERKEKAVREKGTGFSFYAVQAMKECSLTLSYFAPECHLLSNSDPSTTHLSRRPGPREARPRLPLRRRGRASRREWRGESESESLPRERQESQRQQERPSGPCCSTPAALQPVVWRERQKGGLNA
jgi:hypothetical protein